MGGSRSPTPRANQLRREQPCLFTSTCWTNHLIFPTYHVMKNVRRPHPPGASFRLKEKDVSHKSELCFFCVRVWLPGSVHTQISVRQVLSTYHLPGSIGPGMMCGEKAGKDSVPALPSASPAWLLQTQQEAGQHAPLTFDALLSAPGHPGYLDRVLTALSPVLVSSHGP